jgi:hypothetical protein
VDFSAQHTIQVPLHQQLASVPQHQHHLEEPKNEMEFKLRPQWRLWNFTSQKPKCGKCGLIHQWQDIEIVLNVERRDIMEECVFPGLNSNK